MIIFLGIILLLLGVFQFYAGVATLDHAESAFHQIYASVQQMTGATTVGLGIVVCALGWVAIKLASIDRTLKNLHIEATKEERAVEQSSPPAAQPSLPSSHRRFNANPKICPNCGRRHHPHSTVCECGANI